MFPVSTITACCRWLKWLFWGDWGNSSLMLLNLFLCSRRQWNRLRLPGLGLLEYHEVLRIPFHHNRHPSKGAFTWPCSWVSSHRDSSASDSPLRRRATGAVWLCAHLQLMLLQTVPSFAACESINLQIQSGTFYHDGLQASALHR